MTAPFVETDHGFIRADRVVEVWPGAEPGRCVLRTDDGRELTASLVAVERSLLAPPVVVGHSGGEVLILVGIEEQGAGFVTVAELRPVAWAVTAGGPRAGAAVPITADPRVNRAFASRGAACDPTMAVAIKDATGLFAADGRPVPQGMSFIEYAGREFLRRRQIKAASASADPPASLAAVLPGASRAAPPTERLREAGGRSGPRSAQAPPRV